MPTTSVLTEADSASVVAGRGATTPRWPAMDRDAQFIELLNGYRRSGGLARASDVMSWLQQRGAGDIATVARWIVQGDVVHFRWETETWLPVFQFGAARLQPHAAVRRSILELTPSLQPWELAQWFARAHVHLAGRCPADVLADDPEALWQSARAERLARSLGT